MIKEKVKNEDLKFLSTLYLMIETYSMDVYSKCKATFMKIANLGERKS